MYVKVSVDPRLAVECELVAFSLRSAHYDVKVDCFERQDFPEAVVWLNINELNEKKASLKFH